MKYQFKELTVSGHADINAFPKSTELTLVPCCLVYNTVVVPLAVVLEVFLNCSSEEAL